MDIVFDFYNQNKHALVCNYYINSTFLSFIL